MFDNNFYWNIDYNLYNTILTNIIDDLKFLSCDKYVDYLYAYLEALYDFKIIDGIMFAYCFLNIREELRKYEKENKLE